MTFHFPRYSWLITLLTFTVVAFLTVGWFRTSVTELKVLLIPSDAKSTALATQVVETLSEDIQTVAFADQLVKKYPEQATAWNQLTAEEKRAWWTGQVATERVKNSGIVKITLTGASVSQSQTLALQMVEVLRAEPKRLYGESSSVGVVILEQPASMVRVIDPFTWMIATLSLGVLVDIVLLFLIGRVQAMIKLPAPNFSPMPSTPTQTLPTPVDFASLSSGRFRPRTQPETLVQPLVITDTPADPFSVKQSVPAAEKPLNKAVEQSATPAAATTRQMPGNLQFVDAEAFSWEAALPGLKNAGVRSTEHGVSQHAVQESADQVETFAMKEDGKPVEPVAPALEEPTKPTEPTEEELKRRLNQLLRGEM